MRQRAFILAAAASLCGGLGGADATALRSYKALRFVPPAASTWAVMDRDGANRPVTPYLSSLAAGEQATGVIASPSFTLAADAVRFTICGHDGQGGGQQKNCIALVDSKTGETLQTTCAPGNDAMQPGVWNVAVLKGREVRIEARDGVAAGAFAWLGVGTLDCGPAMRIDFSKGLPGGWKAAAARAEKPSDRDVTLVAGGVPFLATRSYSMVPPAGAAEIAVGVEARRLYFLGGTIARGKPLETYGRIEIAYRGGAVDTVPLLYGFTLDGEYKLASPSRASYLRPSADPFQYCFVVAPRPAVIETIRLAREPGRGEVPRITAITCETGEVSDTIEALPDSAPSAEEEAWCKAHAISAGALDLDAIKAEIARAHRVPGAR